MRGTVAPKEHGPAAKVPLYRISYKMLDKCKYL